MFDAFTRFSVLLLAGTFAWSAVAKLVRWGAWRGLVEGYRLGPLTPAATVAAPLVEAGLVVALLTCTRWGAAAALVALVAFSGAILRLKALEGDRLPCGCFGRTKRRDYRLSLARNGLLASLAVLATVRDVDLYAGITMPSGAELVPAALIVAGIAVAIWLGVMTASSFKRGSDG